MFLCVLSEERLHENNCVCVCVLWTREHTTVVSPAPHIPVCTPKLVPVRPWIMLYLYPPNVCPQTATPQSETDLMTFHHLFHSLSLILQGIQIPEGWTQREQVWSMMIHKDSVWSSPNHNAADWLSCTESHRLYSDLCIFLGGVEELSSAKIFFHFF